MKALIAVLTASVLAFAMTMPTVAQDKDKMKDAQHESAESHPNIQAAIQHLQGAKKNLAKGAHDFGGHPLPRLNT